MTAAKDGDDVYETPLPAEEFERRLLEALTSVRGAEGAEIREHIEWFLKRYPSPLARLNYARRKYEEAVRFRGVARAPR